MATSAGRTAEAVREIGGLVAFRLVDGLQQSEQSASGNLESSIEPRFTFGADKITIDVLMAEYGYWVDAGRKPGKPAPVSAIRQWLQYPNVRDRLTLRDKAFDESTLNSLAYLISRKIGREGTKGNNFIKNVAEDGGLWNDASVALADGAQADLVADIDEMLGQFYK